MNKQKKKSLNSLNSNIFFNITDIEIEIVVGKKYEDHQKLIAFEFLDLDPKTALSNKVFKTSKIEGWDEEETYRKSSFKFDQVKCDEELVRKLKDSRFRVYLIDEKNRPEKAVWFCVNRLLYKKSMSFSFFNKQFTFKINCNSKIVSKFLKAKLNPLIFKMKMEKEFVTKLDKNNQVHLEFNFLGKRHLGSYMYTEKEFEKEIQEETGEEAKQDEKETNQEEVKEETNKEEVKEKANQEEEVEQEKMEIENENTEILKDKPIKEYMYLIMFMNDYRAKEVHDECKKRIHSLSLKSSFIVEMDYPEEEQVEEEQPKKGAKATKKPVKNEDLDLTIINEKIDSTTLSDKGLFKVNLTEFISFTLRKLIYKSTGYLMIEQSDNAFVEFKTKLKLKYPLYGFFDMNDDHYSNENERFSHLNDREALVSFLKKEIKDSCTKIKNDIISSIPYQRLVITTKKLSKDFKRKIRKIVTAVNRDRCKEVNEDQTLSVLSSICVMIKSKAIFFIEGHNDSIEQFMEYLKEIETKTKYNLLRLKSDRFACPIYSHIFSGYKAFIIENPNEISENQTLNRFYKIFTKYFIKELTETDLYLQLGELDKLMILSQPKIEIPPVEEIAQEEEEPLEINEVEEPISKEEQEQTKDKPITDKPKEQEQHAEKENQIEKSQAKSKKNVPKNLDMILQAVLPKKTLKNTINVEKNKNATIYRTAIQPKKDINHVKCKRVKNGKGDIIDQVMELQKKIYNDKDNYYTFSKDYLSQSISPIDYINSLEKEARKKSNIIISRLRTVSKLDDFKKQELTVPFKELYQHNNISKRHVYGALNKKGKMFIRHIHKTETLNPLQIDTDNSRQPLAYVETRNTGKQFDYKKNHKLKRLADKYKPFLDGNVIKKGIDFKEKTVVNCPVSIFKKVKTKDIWEEQRKSENYFELFSQPEKSTLYRPQII